MRFVLVLVDLHGFCSFCSIDDLVPVVLCLVLRLSTRGTYEIADERVTYFARSAQSCTNPLKQYGIEAFANFQGNCRFREYAGEPAQNAPPAHLRRAPPPPSVGMVLRDKDTGLLLK